jgi:hypothetical protein
MLEKRLKIKDMPYIMKCPIRPQDGKCVKIVGWRGIEDYT